MKYFTLYRKDFKIDGDGNSFFEGCLYATGIDESKWDKIEEVEIGVAGILNVHDAEGNTIE